MVTNIDIFNEVISDKNKKLIEKAFENRTKIELFNKVEKELPTLVRSYVKDQTGKIQTLSPKDISSIVNTAIANIPPPKQSEKVIERIIEKPKTIIREVDNKDYEVLIKKVEKSLLERIEKEIESLSDRMSQAFASVPRYIAPMLPNYQGQDGKVLSVSSNALKWTEGGGGLSSGTYTILNANTRRTFNADNTSLDELADVIATIISDLGGT